MKKTYYAPTILVVKASIEYNILDAVSGNNITGSNENNQTSGGMEQGTEGNPDAKGFGFYNAWED